MTIVIEKDVPLPAKRGRPPGPLAEQLQSMPVGDSILVADMKDANARCYVWYAQKKTGFRFTAHKTSKGIRVCRVS